jgi:hypothetical protein
MSIKVIIQAPGLALQAQLRDDALPVLIKLTQDFREEQAVAMPAPATGGTAASQSGSGGNSELTPSEEQAREWLKSHGVAELLNRLTWESFPEKILLLGAWYEARGGETPWRSAHIDDTFSKAKEKPPGNFPREISKTIKAGWVHAATPRTYVVTRTGWNKIAEAHSKAGAV